MNIFDMIYAESKARDRALRKTNYKQVTKLAIAYTTLDKGLKQLRAAGELSIHPDPDMIHTRAIQYRKESNRLWHQCGGH